MAAPARLDAQAHVDILRQLRALDPDRELAEVASREHALQGRSTLETVRHALRQQKFAFQRAKEQQFFITSLQERFELTAADVEYAARERLAAKERKKAEKQKIANEQNKLEDIRGKCAKQYEVNKQLFDQCAHAFEQLERSAAAGLDVAIGAHAAALLAGEGERGEEATLSEVAAMAAEAVEANGQYKQMLQQKQTEELQLQEEIFALEAKQEKMKLKRQHQALDMHQQREKNNAHQAILQAQAQLGFPAVDFDDDRADGSYTKAVLSASESSPLGEPMLQALRNVDESLRTVNVSWKDFGGLVSVVPDARLQLDHEARMALETNELPRLLWDVWMAVGKQVRAEVDDAGCCARRRSRGGA